MQSLCFYLLGGASWYSLLAILVEDFTFSTLAVAAGFSTFLVEFTSSIGANCLLDTFFLVVLTFPKVVLTDFVLLDAFLVVFFTSVSGVLLETFAFYR